MRIVGLLILLLASANACAAQPIPTPDAAALHVTRGKSSIVALPSDAVRLSVGDPEVADVMMIKPRELYVLGKKTGTTNLMVWTKDGNTTVLDLSVGLDVDHVRAQLRQLMPAEDKLVVDALGDTVVIGGTVRDLATLQRLLSLGDVLGDGKKALNLVRVQTADLPQPAGLAASPSPVPLVDKPEVIRGIKRTAE
jgi:pilus assembly protein CpaC